MAKCNILGVKFDTLNVNEIADTVVSRILHDRANPQNERTKPFIIVTPNPEIVMSAQSDKRLKKFINSADITAADGIGIVWASKHLKSVKTPIKDRASGYDIVQALFRRAKLLDGGLTAFFFGGGEEAVQKAAVKMEQAHLSLIVAGTRSGYFSASDTPAIIDAINGKKPDILLVGLGSPKQERWVMQNAERLNVSVVMVVGGSFDVMSGNLRRAPKVFQKLGLEWLYRLIKQPKRIKRMAKLPLFVVKVLVENVKK